MPPASLPAPALAAPLRDLLSRRDHPPADDAAFISIDGRGADVRVRKGGEYSVERIGFDKVRRGQGRGRGKGCFAGGAWMGCRGCAA